MTLILQTLVAVSLCWFVASSLWVYPHSLSYFNESIGGPLNGPQHLLGSNVDWEQDLRYAEAFRKRLRDSRSWQDISIESPTTFRRVDDTAFDRRGSSGSASMALVSINRLAMSRHDFNAECPQLVARAGYTFWLSQHAPSASD